jgi:hypothetical protein
MPVATHGQGPSKIHILKRQHIKWKPTYQCKLWKLQSEPHNVDLKEGSWEVGGVIFKSSFANNPSTSYEFCTSPLPPFISLLLDQDHVAQIEVFIACTGRWFPVRIFLSWAFYGP